MKRIERAKHWTAGTGMALICLLSPALAQDAEDSPVGGGAAPEGTAAPIGTPQQSSEASESESNTEESQPRQSDADVLAKAPTMEIEQLEEMVQVFQRLGNREMVEALSKVLLTKDPDNKIAVAVSETGTGQTAIESVIKPDVPSATDRELARADMAVAAGRHDEAAQILRRLKASEFRGKSFSHQQDLAYALLESGRVEAAEHAFRELVNDSGQSRADRADAEARLVDIKVQTESKRVRLLLGQDKDDEAIALAERLLKLHPDNESALALKAEVLTKAARHAEAAEFLKELKRRHGEGPFVFQQSLAYAVYESAGRAESEPYFRELASAGYPEEQRLDARDRLRDFRIERLYERGMKAIQSGDAKSALRIGNSLMQADPIPNEAYELRALALKAQRKYAEAAELLELYKRSRYPDEPFPMQGDLADCYAGTGDFVKAKRTYNEIIDAPVETDPDAAENVEHARLALAGLAPITDPYISGYSEFFTEEEGDMFRATLEGRTGIIGRHQFGIRAHLDEIDLAESIIATGDYDRWDASATYTLTLPNRYFADLTGGGSEDEFLYGAGIGQHNLTGMGWKIYFAGNERATDSLTLEALDGRQDAVHFDVSAYFGNGWNFDGRFNVRQVTVDGVDIGDGFQADVQFGKTLREMTPITSGIYVGYVGEFSDFSYDSQSASDLRTITGSNEPVILPAIDILESLVEERINRQSVEIILERQITPRIAAAIIGGLGWEFEDEEFVYRAGVNVNYKLRDNVYLQAGLDYDSSGNAGSSGSEVVFASIFLRIFF